MQDNFAYECCFAALIAGFTTVARTSRHFRRTAARSEAAYGDEVSLELYAVENFKFGKSR